MGPVYKNDKRLLAMFVIAGIAAIPMAVDGFTQMLTDYESTATMRLITGNPFGFLVGVFMAASFSAKACIIRIRPIKCCASFWKPLQYETRRRMITAEAL